MTIGKWGELPEQLAIVGGNCSIHGFNKKSEDVLWTVTGDNVSSLALLDFNSDGYNEVCFFFLFNTIGFIVLNSLLLVQKIMIYEYFVKIN
jgi:hypothetical protein